MREQQFLYHDQCEGCEIKVSLLPSPQWTQTSCVSAAFSPLLFEWGNGGSGKVKALIKISLLPIDA